MPPVGTCGGDIFIMLSLALWSDVNDGMPLLLLPVSTAKLPMKTSCII